jgi:hypothetical protein
MTQNQTTTTALDRAQSTTSTRSKSHRDAMRTASTPREEVEA